jgi:delta(3,5)-delta(2,4)-dienoyl-CoA isomerase
MRKLANTFVVNFSRVLKDKDSLMAAAFKTASEIAAKSPIAVQGTKISLVYARDHSVPDALNQVVSTLKLKCCVA